MRLDHHDALDPRGEPPEFVPKPERSRSLHHR
jgi:hypothetical protein